ncbi:MAG: hypothetical protein HPY78_09745 [Brevinematales bacterium]|nr:hypothetical protein [Brevinematales bacterium]
MKKLVLCGMVLAGILGCAKAQKATASPVVEPKRDYGYVIYASSQGNGEWLLVDSEGRRLVPLNLSPALKVHNLRVYFSYEEVSRREDGLAIVRIVSIAIE